VDVLATNGRISLRAFAADDEAALLAGRDDEWRRWLGPGHDHPHPTACIVVDDEIVGWVDSDPDHPGLGAGETNVGYSVFAPHRGKGYATDALVLLVQWLESATELRTATLSIHRDNHASLRVARKAGFAPR
jgi:RimJ/RimL family protein N-acetyltransferase